MKNFKLTDNHVKEYHADGYVLVKRLFSVGEVNRMYSSALEDAAMGKNSINVKDKTGKNSKLSLWFKPGNDIFGYMTRSLRMVHAVGKLLDSDAPVCHFHSKLMQKEPKVGGAWEWHQDYGYWYKNQFMFPDQMMSVMVALTEANKGNGCLQVIRGSHKIGRLNHGFSGEQVGADQVMVENALKSMELIYCELEPGDALFFHSNLLHRSEANLSEHPRWSIISCYTSQSNLAYNEQSTSWKTPVDIVPNKAILKWEAASLSQADFLKKENDPALKATGWDKDVKPA